MSEIFVSHAVADQKLAQLLVDFLKEAIGVPASSIFCSSVKGHDIPFGEDFNDYIKEKIRSPKLVILLMTPAYVESLFCLMELGAAWAQSTESLAVVVPPTDFSIVTKTLGLKQAWNIIDNKGLVDLRKLVQKALSNLEKRTEHTWDEKRTNWGLDLKKAVSKLQQATKVDAKAHDEVIKELAGKEEEVERLETALERARGNIKKLEELKDKEEVKSLKKQTADSKALLEEFEELLSAVAGAQPKTSKVVLRHIILDHFDRAGSIDWYSDKAEFEDAIKYGLISTEDYHVEWGREKLKRFQRALQDLETFLGGPDGSKVRNLQEDDVPMDPDDLEFWKYHLDV